MCDSCGCGPGGEPVTIARPGDHDQHEYADKTPKGLRIDEADPVGIEAAGNARIGGTQHKNLNFVFCR